MCAQQWFQQLGEGEEEIIISLGASHVTVLSFLDVISPSIRGAVLSSIFLLLFSKKGRTGNLGQQVA